MKKIILTLLAIAVVYGVFTEISHKSPLNDPKKVVLYTMHTCPYSTKAKKVLKRENIAYTECDIKKSKSCRSAFNNLGARGVPTLVINGQIKNDYSQAGVLNELAKSGS